VVGAFVGLFTTWAARKWKTRQLFWAVAALFLSLSLLWQDHLFWYHKKVRLGLPGLGLIERFLHEVRSEWWVSPAIPVEWQYITCGLVTGLILLGAGAMARGQRGRLWLLMANLVAPLVFLLIARPGAFFSARYLLYLLPIAIVFVAHGLDAVRRVAGGAIGLPLTLLLLGLQALGIASYLKIEKQDWRGATGQVIASLTPGRSIPILAGPSRADLGVVYYLQRAGFSLEPMPATRTIGAYWYQYFRMRRGDLEARVYPPIVRPLAFQDQVARAGFGLYIGSRTEDPTLKAGGYPAVIDARLNSVRESSWPGQFPWSEIEVRRVHSPDV
jgi:hypothetical protein